MSKDTWSDEINNARVNLTGLSGLSFSRYIDGSPKESTMRFEITCNYRETGQCARDLADGNFGLYQSAAGNAQWQENRRPRQCARSNGGSECHSCVRGEIVARRS